MILQGTVVWPHLFEPTQFEQNEPKYELNLLVRKDDEQMDDIRAVIEELVNDKMNGSCSPEQLPIKDCDQRDDSGEDFAGCYMIPMRSVKRPGVVDMEVQPIIDPDGIRGGDTVNVDCNFYYYSAGKKGIACGLNNVQLVKSGDHVIGGGRMRPEAVFAPIGGTKPKAKGNVSF